LSSLNKSFLQQDLRDIHFLLFTGEETKALKTGETLVKEQFDK